MKQRMQLWKMTSVKANIDGEFLLPPGAIVSEALADNHWVYYIYPVRNEFNEYIYEDILHEENF
jgi:hypothetical protein